MFLLIRLTHAPEAAASYEVVQTLVSGQQVVIGRDTRADIQVYDVHASRRHAILTVKEHCVVIRDASSTNGTFVNYDEIQVKRLKHLDNIFIGDDHLLFVSTCTTVKGKKLDFDQVVSDDESSEKKNL